MQDRLQLLAEHWGSYKIWLIDAVGLSNDAMHVHGSLLILCVSALVLWKRLDSPWCWLIVFIAELFNEYADLQVAVSGEATMDAALHDIYNTMFWPTVLLILGRVLFPREQAKLVSPAPPSSDLSH